MAYAQSQFKSFHTIILYGYDSSLELRDRRDTIIDDLKKNISDDAPPYRTFSQGSYALDTGIKPLNGNPDLDIGVVFDCEYTDYPDSLSLKRYVYKALERHNRTVNYKKPCVTVTYLRDGNPLHHIDLAIYSKDALGNTYLARGKDTDAVANRVWEKSDAEGLISEINGKYDEENSNQYRRCIRALKRWKDEKIGHKNCPSIGLTVAAYKWFSPSYDITTGEYRDLLALINLVDAMLLSWTSTRLYLNSPVAPYADLFERMTDAQMSDFKRKLEALRDALEEARLEPDLHEACKILRRQFGSDFPVPDKEETKKTNSAVVVTSGRSA